ncbi:MAG: tRNA (cytidine/uridine-2'-O-)-methyltransferase, partial [Verrucomicrobiales bacterium]
GLDYWQYVDCRQWKTLADFMAGLPEAARTFFLTTKASRAHWDVQFQLGDWLIFGCETRGLPESLLEKQSHSSLLRVPMRAGGTRSLNLATSVAIVLYEGLRQVDGGAGGDLSVGFK